MKTNPKLHPLIEIPENKLCFDCGSDPACWASVNNGIFLCLNCSGNHRSFGLSISFIKSVSLDKWNDSQVKMMAVGGNKKLSELLAAYEIEVSTDKQTLYQSKLLDYYRKQVSLIVNKLT